VTFPGGQSKNFIFPGRSKIWNFFILQKVKKKLLTDPENFKSSLQQYNNNKIYKNEIGPKCLKLTFVRVD
jgi:hypothetical protein